MGVKHASNKPARAGGPPGPLHGGEHADAVRGLWDGSLGRTVRCVPTRRTLAVVSNGTVLYAKLRRGDRGAAAAEWRWLHVLPLMGIATAAPVAWIARARRSLLVTRALPGRSLDAWACDAARAGWLPELVDWVCRDLAAFVRHLHRQNLIHRDLNAAHLFVDDPRRGGAPALLDVERVFRPRWRRRRWIVKDLASLLASSPVALPPLTGLRFLRRYLDAPLYEHRRLMRAIATKAARIRAHRPKFG